MKAKVMIYIGLAPAAALLVSACSGQINNLPEVPASTEDNVEAGRRLIASYGGGLGHPVPGIPQLPRWQIKPGKAMPNMGIRPDEARHRRLSLPPANLC